MTETSTQPPSPKPKPRYTFGRFLRLIAITYILLLVVLAVMQTSLIFPGHTTQGTPRAKYVPTSAEKLVELKTSTGEKVVAVLALAKPNPSSRPTIIFTYGNGMCLGDCSDIVQLFQRAGVNVLLPDYLGYGLSEGKPSEAGVYATVEACWDFLQTQPEIDKSKIVPVGWSLGGAAAVHLAQKYNLPRLVTISAFTSINGVARKHFPYLPTGLIVRHHFKNDEKLRSIQPAHLILHGEHDQIIPVEMAHELHAISKNSKVHILPSDHNDIFDIGGDAMIREIVDFVEGVSPDTLKTNELKP